jgi:ribose 1,5-bisphosphokinase
LISYVRNRLNGNGSVFSAHRYITRVPEAEGENHVALSREEFLRRLEKGLFAMHWRSHGCYYGIGIEIDHWLSKGCQVLVNGSRSYLPEAQQRYPDLKVILIEVSLDVLKRRLEARGRETPEQIQARLERNNQINDALVIIPHAVINNNGALDKAGEMLIQNLLRHRR